MFEGSVARALAFSASLWRKGSSRAKNFSNNFPSVYFFRFVLKSATVVGLKISS